MLVGDYGSDSEGEGSSSVSPPSIPLAPTSKPSNAQARPKKAPKKIAIDLPAISKNSASEYNDGETRPSKRSKIETKSAGSSALFSMLPAPKVKNPTPAAAPRVLGSGSKPGLVFGTSSTSALSMLSAGSGEKSYPEQTSDPKPTSSSLFTPTSVTKGKANVSLEDGGIRARTSNPPVEAADFFSLDAKSSALPSSKSFSLPKISSAPKIEEYIPPEPTPNDPYPGYYMLPSGSWAQYDAEYYQKFYDKWKADYNAQIRSLEKGLDKGFEGADDENTREVNAQREMERARREIQELEERKKLTLGNDAPVGPNMNVQGAKLGKVARTRHQLTTLLADAYSNREILEAKIAEGKRNRKEAGNKYGF